MVDTDYNIDLIKNDTQVKSTSEYGDGEIWKEIDPECIPRKCFVMLPKRYYMSNHGRVISIRQTKKETKVQVMKQHNLIHNYLVILSNYSLSSTPLTLSRFPPL